MDGGVQVQHQPSSQDPTRQSWRNNNSNADQDLGSASRTVAVLPGVKEYASLRTPKIAQYPRSGQHQMPSPSQSVFVSRSPPQAYSLSRSPPKSASSTNAATASAFSRQPQQQKTSNSIRPTPKPLNLSKASSQVPNLGRVPQTATFPPRVNRALNLPNPPKTATFAKPTAFPRDIRQTVRTPQTANMSQQAYTLVYGDQTSYVQPMESPKLRRYSASPAPVRLVGLNYRQVELAPGTPMVVLSHPDDSDSQGSSPPTPGYLPPESFTGADVYDSYAIAYEGEEVDDGQYYYYYYDYPQEYLAPQTPTGTTHQQRASTIPAATKDQRRRSVFGGPMKVHPDAVLPIRQPKGPDMAKNFATRIRRKAVNKLYAAAAERRSKSAADRRKSAMF